MGTVWCYNKMPPKKKPLEDARKRLQEKLSNVEEQSEYICQFINDLVNKVTGNKKDFRHYMRVSVHTMYVDFKNAIL